MFVCICNSISDKTIKRALQNGATSVDDLTDLLGVGNSCGRCLDFAQEIVTEAQTATAASICTIQANGVGVVTFNN